MLIQKLENIYERAQANIISEKWANFKKYITENTFYRGGNVAEKIKNIKECFTSILYDNISSAEKYPIIQMEIENILKNNPYQNLGKLKELMAKVDVEN